MEFYRVWRILVGNKWLIIWLPIISACVGLGVAYILPEQYESTALVLVRPEESFRFNSNSGERKEVLDFPLSQSAPIDAPSKTYMEVIKSRAVAEKIVAALRLDVTPREQPGSWLESVKEELKDWLSNTLQLLRNYAKYGRNIPVSSFEKAVETLEERLTVSVRKDTYAFDITYRSKDPKQAAAVANMAAEIFLEHSSVAYRVEAVRALKFAEARLEESRKALEAARAATLTYKQGGGTFDLSAEYSERLKVTSDLEGTLAKIEGRLAGLLLTSSKDSPAVIAQEAEKAELKRQLSALREQLSAYPDKERRLNAITLAERLAKDSYEFFLKRYEEARVKEAAGVNEIRIISNAVPGRYPVKPVKYLYAGLSFLMGLVIAVAWALLVGAQRVHTAQDLAGDLGVPILGMIPTLKRS
jgi:uncharacterized protein involved in exopolysaccharide biosynthesis